MRGRFLVVVAACLLAQSAAAQEGVDPESSAPFHLGPIAIAPSVTLRNLGIDTNVFNETNDAPRSDFTATLGATVETWWRVGRARVKGTNSVDLVYFNRYAHQRSVNAENGIRVELPLNRIKPYTSVSVLKIRERPTVEIDVRAARVGLDTVAGVEVRMTGKLSLDINSSHSRTAYENSDDPFASVLHTALTGRMRQTHVALRYASTPLTTFVLAMEQQKDQFDFSSERNADSVGIKPGIEFKPLALITGSASVGYRRFRPLTAAVPEFIGAVADVDLAYTLLGTTRVAARVERDVGFSFEATQPYYILTGISASLDRHLGGAWDALARAGRQELAYRNVIGSTFGSRVDTVATYGVSLGYRIARDRRIGADVDYLRRRSALTGRNYEGLRFGLSATYPF